MKHARKLRRILALFFLLNIATQITAPSISYALTSGPTAPEATSFEPVDTTDLVNLQTGDFVYNTPLLEIPGPAGSYPLGLSYHAGIQPDQEASWVGLGFTVNPGAITRLVNGYPDDHSNVKNVDRTFWAGGVTTTQTIGVSVGLANCATVTAGLTFAQDTYRGMGNGLSLGVQFGPKGSPVSASFSGGRSPYGGLNYSTGLIVGVGEAGNLAKANGRVGLSYNSDGSFGMDGGVDVSWEKNKTKSGESAEPKTGEPKPAEPQRSSTSLIGASIDTKGGPATLSIAGVTSGVENSRVGNISTYSDNTSFDIPTPVPGLNVKLGRSYQRYWMDETVSVGTFGALNLPGAEPGFENAFDTYDILDNDLNLVDFSDPEKVLGGSFPDYDQYTISAQGLSGNIQPYLFQKNLYRQDKKKKEGDDDVVYARSYSLSQSEQFKASEFRFVNDFSNRYEYNPENFQLSGTNLSFEFANQPVTGQGGSDGYIANKLAGSRDIYWFTNAQIVGGDNSKDPFALGFIDTDSEGFTRENNSQLGGFSVTNASGVTYHYALPAYSFNEYMKTQKIDEKGVLSFNELKKPEKYAYTWFLTSMTGPDYVDKNLNGKVDGEDYGYWINFSYKKWISDFNWRNPAEGFNKDVDGEFDFFSYGQKEIYYLERISSATHVAVFEKSERIDSREVSSLVAGGFHVGSVLVTPGKQQCMLNCDNNFCVNGNCDQAALQQCNAQCMDLADDVYEDVVPRALLKLDRIKLYNARDFRVGNVSIDKVLRSIEFGYDYSLSNNTPNSFAPDDFNVKKGKLTLKTLQFQGKGAASLVPPMTFAYDNNPDYLKDGRDMWGFYKSDYKPGGGDNLTRLTSVASSAHVDAWSLNAISTSLGSVIRIKYESDTYHKPPLYNNSILTVRDSRFNADNQSLVLKFVDDGIDLTNYASILQKSNVELLLRKPMELKDGCICGENGKFLLGGFIGNKYYELSEELNGANILNIWPDSIEFRYSSAVQDLLPVVNTLYTETPCVTTTGAEIQPRITLIEPQVVSGNLIFIGDAVSFGGGLRVKEISLDNAFANTTNTTLYEYGIGTTSYEPISLGKLFFNFHTWDKSPWKPESDRAKTAKNSFSKTLYQNFSSLLGTARIVPGPGVMYSAVTLREKVTTDGQTVTLPNYSVYQFDVFSPGMVGFQNTSPTIYNVSGSHSGVAYSEIDSRNVILKDYTTRVGALKGVSLYNEGGTLVSATTNNYLHDGLDATFNQNVTKYESDLNAQFTNQGLIEETFTRARIVLYKKDDKIPYGATDPNAAFLNDQRRLVSTLTKRETFPSIQVGQTNINYKTGVKIEAKNLAFDFYSGEVTKVLSSDSYGNRYVSETIPAYTVYPEMGLRIYNQKNKHMLSQSAGQLSYKIDNDNSPIGLLDATIHTWGRIVPVLGLDGIQSIWRKQASYAWNGNEPNNADGTYPMNDFEANSFNRVSVDQNRAWEKMSEITLYDIYSHGLEASDINGNFASTRRDPRQERIIASTFNAAYNDAVFSSAEFSAGNNIDEGGVNRGNGNPSILQAHTGKYGLLLGVNGQGFNYTLKKGSSDLARKYHASVWLYTPNDGETQSELSKMQLYYSINGVEHETHATPQKNKSKNWYLLNLDIIPEGANDIFVGVRNKSGRGVYFDDFRVHPVDAAMTSYVYDPFSGEVNYILDGNNLYTRFEYDAMGRSVRSSREQMNFDFGDGKESFKADKITSELIYNYGKKN